MRPFAAPPARGTDRARSEPGGTVDVTMSILRLAAAGTLLAGACLSALPASATFVHMVGRTWMIEQWIKAEFDGSVVELTPIMHHGNPAFRVSFIPGGASGASTAPPRTLIIDAGSMQPVEEIEDDAVPRP